MTSMRQGAVACLVAGLAISAPADATEDGNTHADLGYIDTLAGLPLPPGFYLRDDVSIQTSGRLNNQYGKPVNLNLGPLGTVGLKFRATVAADIFAAYYTPDYRIPHLNATIGIAAYEYVANARAEAATVLGTPDAGATSKAGFGDMTIVPIFLGFDVPRSNLHFVVSPLEFTAPVGRYDKNDPIGNNIGLNYWSYRPALEMTYLNKTGQEFSLNMSTSINTQNQATHYRSGDEFYFTYAFQQYFSPVWGGRRRRLLLQAGDERYAERPGGEHQHRRLPVRPAGRRTRQQGGDVRGRSHPQLQLQRQ